SILFILWASPTASVIEWQFQGMIDVCLPRNDRPWPYRIKAEPVHANAAITRTFARMARTPPSRTNSRSCSARRTLSSRAVLNEALVPIRLVDMGLCLSHRLANGFQQIGGIERLVEEIGGTALKRLLTDFLLVMRRNENHGQGRALEADAAL